jgi:hypothetical protein
MLSWGWAWGHGSYLSRLCRPVKCPYSNLFDRVRDLRVRSADPEAAGLDAVWARNLASYYDPPDIHPTPDPLSVP